MCLHVMSILASQGFTICSSPEEERIGAEHNPGLAKIYVSFHVFKDMKPFAIIFKKYMIWDSPPKDRQRLCHTPGLLALNL